MGINFTYGIFPAYLRSLGATDLIISIGAASLYLSRGVSGTLIDKLSYRYSFKRLFMTACCISILGTISIMIFHNPLIVSLLRIIQGFSSGLFWVLINIYSCTLGPKSLDKFKNLTSVSIYTNFGAFIACLIGGKLASIFSPTLCFYLSLSSLALCTFLCKYLQNINRENSCECHARPISAVLSTREILIMSTSVAYSFVFSFVTLALPLFILYLGGSYIETGIASAIGVAGSVIVLSLAPAIKKRYSYRTIMSTNYILLSVSLVLSFYFKNIVLIYCLQGILTGVSALERNLWYSVLQEHSKNYTKSVGQLRGYIDFFGTFLFIAYGYLIQTFGPYIIAYTVAALTVVCLINILINKKLNFLRHLNTVYIQGVGQYGHILHRVQG